ncbi:hypothetical protein FA13DRAFT_1791747 [Coprinellus micaceus]|uniref:Uncharacterized protein n=1 Tax=Coprinellus micaceus TaxID=71717 RepID=A0A4Y7TA24_COPMI|nr:hypothetical protein FA13DRAFT_1791747 [Coprinellus micaceus]
MPKVASSASGGTGSPTRGRGRRVQPRLGLQERLAPNGENSDVKAVAVEARAARRLKREVDRDGLVETGDAATYWVALQAETATARQLKEANEKLERKISKVKGITAKLQLSADQSLVKIRAYEEMLQAKETELAAMKNLLDIARARADELYGDKMKYWEELSQALRLVDILETAMAGGHDEYGSHSQTTRLCDPIV